MGSGVELWDGPVVTPTREVCGSDLFDTRLDSRSIRRDWLLDGGFCGISVDKWRICGTAEAKLVGIGGTGGMRDSGLESGERTISPLLTLLSLQYGDMTSPSSLAPGRVAESCLVRLLPLLYRFLPWPSLDRIKELAIKARARVVPEMAESSFSETADDG